MIYDISYFQGILSWLLTGWSEKKARYLLFSTLRVNSLPKPCAAPVMRKLPSILCHSCINSPPVCDSSLLIGGCSESSVSGMTACICARCRLGMYWPRWCETWLSDWVGLGWGDVGVTIVHNAPIHFYLTFAVIPPSKIQKQKLRQIQYAMHIIHAILDQFSTSFLWKD